MAEALLAAEGLRLQYPTAKQAVFADVSLTVQPREIVALLGESGCGKSSLLGVIAGLVNPDRGRVTLRDRPVEGKTPPEVALVFQDPCLLPWRSVAANAGFGLDFRNLALRTAERAGRVAGALDEVGLARAARLYPDQLSGGMAQRVALARALARQPELILLDEPFSALDAITREAMQDLLARLVHRHHSAALLVTHDIDEALRVADRVLLMGGLPASVTHAWAVSATLGPAPRRRASPESLRLRDEIVGALAQGAVSNSDRARLRPADFR